MPLRRMSVVGSWYPRHPSVLAAELDQYLARVEDDTGPQVPRALIVPHAGLTYSGPVAAHAYKAIVRSQVRSVILVGPSHFVPFHGVSIWPDGEWETPFGTVPIDRALAREIQAECSQVMVFEAAHGREHSIEMQLPFLAHLLPDAAIVPLVMGHQTPETAFGLGDALARVVADRAEVLLIATSDLSHYHTATTAHALDRVVLDAVSALRPDQLMNALEREPRHACGGGPMVAVLHAARQLGALDARVLHYADSGDVTGDKASVVGYFAASAW